MRVTLAMLGRRLRGAAQALPELQSGAQDAPWRHACEARARMLIAMRIDMGHCNESTDCIRGMCSHKVHTQSHS